MPNKDEDGSSKKSKTKKRGKVTKSTVKIAEPAIPIPDVQPSTVKIVEATIPVSDVIPSKTEEKKNYSK